MADTAFEDRTEQPTQKRLDDARRRGQIPRSKELTMAAVTMAGCLVIWTGGNSLGADVRALMIRYLRFGPEALDDPRRMTEALSQAGLDALAAFAPFIAATVVAAVLGSIAIGGFIFSPAPISFQFDRIDPIKGLGRLFSLNAAVETLKALAKAAVIGGCAVGFLYYSADTVLGLGSMSLGTALSSAMDLSMTTLAICGGGLLLVAAVDAPFQLWSYNRQLRMTRQEIADEQKEMEGRPEVRSRIRALQQETARRRMLADVPRADVVITNPTHFAVALKYDASKMRAPVVLAKGADHVAARIRSVADANRVTLFEAPLLARALYWTTDIGQAIPSQLYLAVAQVLTYVYRLRTVSERGGPMPDKPEVQVDAELAKPQPRGRRRR